MLRKHLLWYGDVGALVHIDRLITTSGDYAQLYDAIERQSKKRDRYNMASIVELDPRQCVEGVYWDWELAGPHGASYRLHILPGVGDDAIVACRSHIRRSYDCVHMAYNRIRRLIELEMPDFQHREICLRSGT